MPIQGVESRLPRRKRGSTARLLSHTMGTEEIHATAGLPLRAMDGEKDEAAMLPHTRRHGRGRCGKEEKLARCEENNRVGLVASDYEVPSVCLFVYHQYE
jgi:hypothetical protein